MKITFEISPEYDAEMIFQMLRGEDWFYRATSMEIGKEFAEKIHNNQRQGEIQEEIKIFVKKAYKKYMPYIEKTKGLYQLSWQEIIKDFSKLVEKLTTPWFYDKYVCVVTHFNQGISNWNGNVVGRWWKENPYLQRKLTAHEIILAHFFLSIEIYIRILD